MGNLGKRLTFRHDPAPHADRAGNTELAAEKKREVPNVKTRDLGFGLLLFGNRFLPRVRAGGHGGKRQSAHSERQAAEPEFARLLGIGPFAIVVVVVATAAAAASAVVVVVVAAAHRGHGGKRLARGGFRGWQLHRGPRRGGGDGKSGEHCVERVNELRSTRFVSYDKGGNARWRFGGGGLL